MQQFLGFCNFYHRFIPRFAKITKPLTKITGKKEYKWRDKEKNAFNKLKDKIMNPLTLAIPNLQQRLQLETNASGYVIGGVLSQQQENNSWRPIVYLLKAINKTERNYKIYNRKLLVTIEGLKK